MADRNNLTNQTVTAGKFVELGQKAQDLKAKLRRISQISQSSSNSAQISGINSMLSDNILTPAEKRQLQAEWEHIQAAYSNTVATVEQLGINPDQFQSFKAAFQQLKVVIEPLLKNMSESTAADPNLQGVLEAYNTAATILQNYINAYQNDLTASVSDYRLAITTAPAVPTIDDTIQFSASIYVNGVDRTSDLMQEQGDEDGLYPNLFDWIIEGTDDDEGYMESAKGKRVISIPASAFSTDNITVQFFSTILIG